MPEPRQIIAMLLCLVAVAASAGSIGERLQSLVGSQSAGPGQGEILDPERAFRLSATAPAPGLLRFNWEVEKGYYLYRDKFSFESLSADRRIDDAGLRIPRGRVKQDESFGEIEVNTGSVIIDVPLAPGLPETTAGENADSRPLLIRVGYQGCKEGSVCYPPISKELEIRPAASSGLSSSGQPDSPAVLSAQDRITGKLRQGGFILNILAFFSFGLLLSLTPCVFPMIPILSGIIVGQPGSVTGRRGFLLSVSYTLAMAATYALLGILAGSLQINLQAASQNAWVIGAFSLVFVILALSMFGFYELQLPAALQSRLAALSGTRQGGGLYSAAVMGAVSALIVGPCVAPPLAGALLYISQTGDALLGGLALFFMGLGFGVPLLALGASAGSLLPRAGAWMEKIKQGFGVVMLGVAIWLLERIIPVMFAMLLWASLIILVALLLGAADRSARGGGRAALIRGVGVAGLIYAGVLIAGALSGADSVFSPLQRLARTNGAAAHAGPDFQRIKTTRDLEEKLLAAGAAGQYAMLDFYADWCVTCIEMEENTFADPEVKQALSQMRLLQADVTRHDAEDRRLLEHFRLFGPPAILFFDKEQRELEQYRLIGYVPPEQFLRHFRRMGISPGRDSGAPKKTAAPAGSVVAPARAEETGA